MSGDRHQRSGGSKPSPKFYIPPRSTMRKSKARRDVKSSEKGKVTRKFYVRQVPLPEAGDGIWAGFDEHMPLSYTKGKKWSCPSCSVHPGEQHSSWCPRAPFEQNPYNSTAYDAKDFLTRAGFAKQIWFGDGHPAPVKGIKVSEGKRGGIRGRRGAVDLFGRTIQLNGRKNGF